MLEKKHKKTQFKLIKKIPDHSYRILIIKGSGAGKTSSLFNLISHQADIDKISSYAKDPYETKCQFEIKNKKSTDLKDFSNFKACIEMIRIIFIITLKNPIQIKNTKQWGFLMIRFQICLVMKNLTQW